jgi:hypothetical protein
MEFAAPSAKSLDDAPQHSGAHGTGRGAAGDDEPDFLAPTHREQPYCTDSIIDFVSHL